MNKVSVQLSLNAGGRIRTNVQAFNKSIKEYNFIWKKGNLGQTVVMTYLILSANKIR